MNYKIYFIIIGLVCYFIGLGIGLLFGKKRFLDRFLDGCCGVITKLNEQENDFKKIAIYFDNESFEADLKEIHEKEEADLKKDINNSGDDGNGV